MNAAPPPSEAIVGGAAPMDMQQFGNLIRSWVHYDNLLASLNKQVKNVRDVRSNYESQVLQMLRTSGTPNPIIQIAGGRVMVGEDKHQQPLSFKSLETMLHQYFRQRPGTRDETLEILKFIREQRQVSVSPCLKRQNNKG